MNDCLGFRKVLCGPRCGLPVHMQGLMMTGFARPEQTTRQIGIRQRSLRKHCRLGRATELVFILATGTVLTLGGPAQAQTVIWEGDDSINYTTGSNWNLGTVPVAGQHAVISGAGLQPTLSAAAAAASVTVTNQGFSIVAGGNLTVTNGLTIGAGGFVAMQAGAVLNGTLTVDGGQAFVRSNLTDVEVENGGYFRNDSTITVTNLTLSGNTTTATRLDSTSATTLTVSGGTLNLATDGQLVTFGGGNGTIVLNPTSFSRAGELAATLSTGTLRLTSITAGLLSNGTTTFNSGTLDMNGQNVTIDSASGAAGTITNTGGGAVTLTLEGTGSTGVGIVNGTGTTSVVLNDSAALTLTGTSTYSGSTTLNDTSTLTLNAGANLSDTAALTVNGGTVNVNIIDTVGTLSGTGGDIAFGTGGRLNVNQAAAGTYAGGMSGNSTLGVVYFEKLGAGTLTLTGTSSVTGAGRFEMTAGTVQVSGGNAIGNNSIASIGAATLELLSDETVGALATNSSSTINLNNNTLTLAGVVTPSGVTTAGDIIGTGNLVYAATDLLTTFATAHSYTGDTTISAGTFRLGINNLINDASDVVVNGGTLDMVGFSDTVASVSLQSGSITGTGTLTSNAAFDVRSGSVSAVLGGTVGLNKTTAGTVGLTGANTYTGATAVSAGTLNVTGTGSIASTAVTVSGTGTLNIDAGALAAGAGVTVSDDGILGTSGTIDFATLALEDSSSVTGSGTLNLTGTYSQSGNTLLGAGVTVSAAGAKSLSGGTIAGTLTGTGTANVTGDTTLASTGTISGGSLIVGGATLTVDGGTISSNVTMNNGTILATAGTTIGSVITLNTATTNSLRAGAGDTLTLTGSVVRNDDSVLNIGSATDTGTVAIGLTGVISVGPGTAVNVQGGTLRMDNAFSANNFLATSSPAVSIAGGASLDVNGLNTSVSNLTGTGTVTNSAGAAAVLGLANSTDTTFGGVIQNGTGNIGIVKLGTGTLTLSGTNTYTNLTAINAGELNVTGSVASTQVNVNATGTLRVNGSSILDTAAVTLFDFGTLILAGSETIGALSSTFATTTVNLNGNTLTTGNANDQTYAGTITGGGAGSVLTKQGSGTLTLSRANSHAGGTTITGGTLRIEAVGALGTGAVTVNAGTALQVATDGSFGNAMSIAGTGVAGGGAIAQVAPAANSSLNGAITLTGDATINAGAILNLGGIVTLGANTLTLTGDGSFDQPSGSITGDGGLTASATGGVVLRSNNTYLGTTTVNANLAVLGGSAINDLGAVVVNSGTFNVAASETVGSIAGAGNINIGSGQTLTTGGNDASTLVSGTITGGLGALTKVGTGTLTLSGANGYGGLTTISAGTLQIGAGGATGTLGSGNVVNNAALVFNRTGSFTVANLISGTGTVTKQNTGDMTLSGANTYQGATTVSAGTLTITDGSALGSTDAGTTVANGATLALSGGIAVGTEAITLDGTGVGAGGALRSVSGVNTIGGAITLGSAAQITTLADSLTISGNVTGTNTDLTLSALGSSLVAISGNIGTGSGGVTKLGTGVATLSGASTYTGTTSVSTGTLRIQSAGALGTAAGGTTVASGATLQIDGGAGITVAGESLTLNGTGASGLGALNNLTGDNTWTGGVTLGSAATVRADGGSLTISGDVTNGGFGLTVTGAGNTTISGAISGDGGVTKDGAGVLTLAGANAHAGLTQVNSGRLVLDGGAAIADTGAVNLSAGTVELADSETVDVFNGTGGSLDLGTSTLTLAGTLGSSFNGLVTGGAGSGLVKNGATTATFTGAFTMADGTITVNDGTLILSNGTNTIGQIVVAGTTPGAATLRIAATGAAGGAAGQIRTTGSVIDLGDGVDNATPVEIASNTTQIQVTTGTATQSGIVSEDAAGRPLEKIGDGTLILSGANTYTGTTTVSAGTLALANAGAVSNGASTLVASGTTLRLDTAANVGALGNVAGAGGTVDLQANTITLGGAAVTDSFAGVITGAGGLTKVGTGTQTLTGANDYAGQTTVNAGVLQIGDAGTSGTLGSGGVAVNAPGTLAFNRTDTVTVANVFTGNGTINQAGTGTTILTGTSGAFVGTTNVNAGVLRVDGTLGDVTSVLNVNNNGTLQGTGTVGGNVTVASGGTLAAGAGAGSAGVLSIGGNLLLQAGSTTRFDLPTPNQNAAATNDRINVTGSVTLGGTLTVDGALAAGYYRLFNANGGASGSFASSPAGATVLTNVTNQVNLRVGNAGSVQYWDGNNFSDNDAIDGGAGTWTSTGTNWTIVNGQFNDAWQAEVGIFQNAGGAVSVQGAQSFQELVFDGAGYSLVDGGGGSLVSPTPGGFSIIETNADAAINVPITGDGGINKTGSAVLSLGGQSTYLGVTDIAAGTLRTTVDNALPSTTDVTVFGGATLDVNGTRQEIASLTGLGTGALALGTGGTLEITGTTATNFAGVVSGDDASVLTQGGTGSLTFTATSASTMTGVLGALDNGTITMAAGATTTAQIVGAADDGTFITNGGALAANAVLATNDAGSTVTLNGSETVGFLANGDATAAGLGTIDLNGAGVTLTLTGTANTLNAGNVSEHAGLIEGAGALTVSGGTHRLSGATANTYEGITTVSGGALELAGGVAIRDAGVVDLTGTGTLRVVDAETIGQLSGVAGTTLDLDAVLTTGGTDASTTMAGLIEGPSGLTKVGTGTFTLSNNGNTYGGITTVSAGTLAVTAGGALGAGDGLAATGTVVATGATLSVDGGITIANERLALSGTGVGDGGALRSISGANTLNGPIVLDAASRINTDADSLTLGGTITNGANTLTVGGVGDTTLNGALGAGSGGLTMDGTGTLTLAADNTFTGATDIQAGTVVVTAAGQLSGTSGVTVGAGTLLDNAGAINAAATTTVAATGQFDNSGTAGAVGNGGAFNNSGSAGALTNTGTATNSGTLASVANDAGTFTSTNGTVTGATTNDALMTINSGTFTGGITNNAAGTINAQGTMSGDVANAGTFTTTGALTGGGSAFTNTNTADIIAGSYTGLGSFANTAGTTTVTGQTLGAGTITNAATLNVTGGTLTGAFGNTGGTTTFGGTSAVNGATTNGAVITALAGAATSFNGPVTNNATMLLNQAGTTTVAGAFSGAGTVDMFGGAATGDHTLTFSGAAGSVGAHNWLMNYTATGVGDRIVATGGQFGGDLQNFTFDLGGDFALGTQAVVVEGQTGLNRAFTVEGAALGGTVVYSLADIGANTVLVAESNPGFGGIASGVSLTQAIIANVVNRPSSPFASGLVTEQGCSRGGYGRGVFGRADASGTSSNGTSTRPNSLSTSYAGVQGGFDVICNDGRFFDGWNGGVGALVGYNIGKTDQPVFGLGGTTVQTSTTKADFSQRYLGFYVVGNRDRLTVDAQVRFENTDYEMSETVAAGFGGLGLQNDTFSTKGVNFTGRVSYNVEVNPDGLSFVPTAGVSVTRTNASRLTFSGNGNTLDLDAYTSKVGFVGGTLARTRINEAGDAGSTYFVSANYYKEFGGDRTATLTTLTPATTTRITSSDIGGFGELSLGWNYVRVLENGPGGARQLNASVRADARSGSNISKSYSLTAQVRLSF